MRAKLAVLFPSLVLLCAASATAAETDWKTVDLVFGRAAAVSGAVHRYGLPRSDLKVSLDGVQIKPGFALGGWVAFEPMGDETMMMGDLVLTEAEINPVMTKLLAEGLQVTAVHNHLLRAIPPTFYMHVSGRGDAEHLARMTRVGACRKAPRRGRLRQSRPRPQPISASTRPKSMRRSASRDATTTACTSSASPDRTASSRME